MKIVAIKQTYQQWDSDGYHHWAESKIVNHCLTMALVEPIIKDLILDYYNANLHHDYSTRVHTMDNVIEIEEGTQGRFVKHPLFFIEEIEVLESYTPKH